MTAMITLQSRALSRRSFLVSAGGVGVAVAFGSLPIAALAAAGALKPNAWVIIGGDDTVTIMAPAAELGQGIMTALPVIVAEEMDADWHRVRVLQSPGDPKTYGNPGLGGMMSTLGSRAVTGYYDELRLIGAQTRKVLIACAAAAWKLPASELSTEPGWVVHKASARKISFGALARKAKLPQPLPLASKEELKPTSAFRLIGKDLPRVELPHKVNGTAKYGMDVELPELLFGAVLHPPVEHEKPVQIDDSAAKKIHGIVKIVPLDHGVGIIGETVEATKTAKAALKVTWSTTAEARHYSSDKVLADYQAVARDTTKPGVAMVAEGDAPAALTAAAKTVTAEYFSDHVAHASMEPLNATALVKGDTVELWLGNQSPTTTIRTCAAVAGTTPDKVIVHSLLVGGAFGRTSDDSDHAAYAVMLAKAVPGRPVKTIWSREDDFTNDVYRPAAVQHIEVALDHDGVITAWRHRVVCPSHFGRISPPLLAHLKGKDVVAAGGGGFRYVVPAHLVEYIRAERGFDIGPWRNTASGYMKFAIEGVIDDLAAMKGEDPVRYRMALLKHDPRAVKVIETVAKMADWDRKRPGRALGIAYSDALDSYLAEIAEISLDEKSGAIKVHNVWAAIDAGIAVQPQNLAYQVEGGIVMGLSAALFEHVNVEDGVVKETNFDSYRVARMSDIPAIEVKVIATDNHPTGVGESGIAPTAPAIANAVARLTGGKRPRHLPMLPDRIKALISA